MTTPSGDDTSAPDRSVVLVVDDAPSNVLILFEILKADYEVCVATSGEAALEFCADRRPDLVLLDINLPGLDGFEVCRRLKGDPSTEDIPIIFVTARDSPGEEARGLEEGAADFISKPFHQSVVKARVRTQITLRRQSQTLRILASTDGLTGLANRRRFDQALEDECRRCVRDRQSLSLMLMDVDHFKAFNDLFGHPAGDRCLQALAAALKPLARRPGDMVARYGGEEFAVLLPRANAAFAAASAAAVAASVQSLALRHPGNADGGGVVTVSIGVGTFAPLRQPLSPLEIIASVDEALYEAKRQGRNRIVRRSD